VVSINTDNRLMSAVSLTEEMHRTCTKLAFTRAELDRMILYGFESAFLPFREREAMVAKVKQELEAIS